MQLCCWVGAHNHEEFLNSLWHQGKLSLKVPMFKVFVCFWFPWMCNVPRNLNTFWMWQVKSEREKKYSEEAFWLRTVSFRENFTEDKFSNLFEVQAAIHKIYSLALENNLGQDIIAEWQQHVIVVQSLFDSLGTKSHRTAMKHLKKIIGATKNGGFHPKELSAWGASYPTSCSSTRLQTRSTIWTSWTLSEQIFYWSLSFLWAAWFCSLASKLPYNML